MEIVELLTLLFSGFGAGVITGMIGASAVTFMAGILIMVLGYSAYTAVGLGLITDVFASLTSAHIYTKAKNIDIKRGILIAIFAAIFAFVGGIASRALPSIALADAVGLITLITGITFLRGPSKIGEIPLFKYLGKRKTLSSILIGVVIGLVAGSFGAGGGIAILISLVFVLNYPIKVAVGTSVFIMAFISLFGGAAHFVGQKFPISQAVIASIGGIIGAIISSRHANKLPEEKMLKITGWILIILGAAVLFHKFFAMAGFSII